MPQIRWTISVVAFTFLSHLQAWADQPMWLQSPQAGMSLGLAESEYGVGQPDWTGAARTQPPLPLVAERGPQADRGFWDLQSDGGAKPWEFQFGIDYSPAVPSARRGAPFFAVNGHVREEVDFGGNFVAQAGWQWRGESGHLFRMGMQYFAGKSNQFQFFDDYEEKLGLAIWYDF